MSPVSDDCDSNRPASQPQQQQTQLAQQISAEVPFIEPNPEDSPIAAALLKDMKNMR